MTYLKLALTYQIISCPS